MFTTPCRPCTAGVIGALEDDRVLGSSAVVLHGFCEHRRVMFTLALHRGVVADWSLQPCENQALFEALTRDARDALRRQARDITEQAQEANFIASVKRGH